MGGRNRDGWKKRGQRSPWEQPGGKPAADERAAREADEASAIVEAGWVQQEFLAGRYETITESLWVPPDLVADMSSSALTPERIREMHEELVRRLGASPFGGGIFSMGFDPRDLLTKRGPGQNDLDQRQAAERAARPDVERFLLKTKHSTAWDDVVGNDVARQALVEAIEAPVRNREIYARYGKKAPKGLLLFGPPGNGKTMFGKAAAAALARLHKVGDDDGILLSVKGPEIKSKWWGEEERLVRAIFAYARAYKALHGFPLVVFFDEADSLLPSRDGVAGRMPNSVEESVVATFLAEMDGLDDSGAFVILATNRPHAIDAAVLRDGRIDRRIKVERPDRDATRIIVERALFQVPLGGGVDLPGLAAAAAARAFDPHQRILQLVVEDRQGQRYAFLTLGDVISGAMAVGLVERAKEQAIRRDIAQVAAGGTPGGVTLDDIEAAIEIAVREARGVDQTAALIEFAQRNSLNIQGIGPIQPAARTIGVEGHEHPVH